MVILIVAVVLVLGAVYFTLAVRPEDLPPQEEVSPVTHLEQRKAAIYENLRDLQFEFRLKKMSEEDYQKTKRDLQGELATVLQEIDRLQPSKPVPAVKKKVVASPSAEPLRYVCPHCSAEFQEDLKFCGNCGKPMKQVQTA